MKNRCKWLFILTLVIIFSFYKEDSVAAMENIQCGTEQNIEPAAVPEGEQNVEAAAVPEGKKNAEPAALPEEEENADPVAVPEEVEKTEPAAVPEEEENVDSATMLEEEQNVDSAAMAGEKQNTEPAALQEPELNNGSDIVSEPVHSVSTGTALTEWLEAHKDIGGTVRLANHVILNEDYCFCPNGMNKPSVVVDTGQYTITVTAEIEFMSDHHLTFRGQPDGKSIFDVEAKGMLSMLGVAVESGQGALWQEEGAGLVVDNCHIAGSIHYAETPFVVDQVYNSVCAVVEKGQTVSDAIPRQIMCTVNRQGQVSHNEAVPLLWNLEGTEKQQKERKRFQIQGSFLSAASAEPALCTVVYNDYPLTFMDVKASAGSRWCSFRGGYTKPEKYLPITVMSEYSFDGESWIIYEEANVKDPNAVFSIVLDSSQCDRTVHPNIYIRLHWDHKGTGYYSNVLCYTADSLEYVGEIGGSRGGGTSIVNPPGEPQESNGTADSKDEKPDQNTEQDADSDNNKSEDTAGAEQTENGIPASHAEQPLSVETPNTGEDRPVYTKTNTLSAEPSVSSEPNCDDGVINIENSDNKKSVAFGDSGLLAKGDNTVASVSAYGADSGSLSRINTQELNSGISHSHGNAIAMAVGLVLLSVMSGIAGFYIHYRSGTKR